jgi:hypothetical protein
MSDPIETALRSLRGQQPPGGFASAGAVRRRGTRRAYRQVLTAGVAALVIASGGVTWFRTGAERHIPPMLASSSPSPSGTSTVAPPVLLTPAMFLTAADLGPAMVVIGQSGEVRKDFWYWQDACTPYHRADYLSLAGRAQMDWRDFSQSGSGVAFQIIERYQPGAGPRNLDDIRTRLRDCAGKQSPDPRIGGPPKSWTLVANGFAGDDAVLAKHELFPPGEPIRESFTVAVRVGDLVSTVQLDAPTSEATAREIAAKAANRLR